MNNTNYMVLGGYKVAKGPQHGKITVSGVTFTYSPTKGFVGVDHFVIEADFVASGSTKLLVNFLDAAMEVTR